MRRYNTLAQALRRIEYARPRLNRELLLRVKTLPGRNGFYIVAYSRPLIHPGAYMAAGYTIALVDNQHRAILGSI